MEYGQSEFERRIQEALERQAQQFQIGRVMLHTDKAYYALEIEQVIQTPNGVNIVVRGGVGGGNDDNTNSM